MRKTTRASKTKQKKTKPVKIGPKRSSKRLHSVLAWLPWSSRQPQHRFLCLGLFRQVVLVQKTRASSPLGGWRWFWLWSRKNCHLMHDRKIKHGFAASAKRLPNSMAAAQLSTGIFWRFNSTVSPGSPSAISSNKAVQRKTRGANKWHGIRFRLYIEYIDCHLSVLRSGKGKWLHVFWKPSSLKNVQNRLWPAAGW